MIAVEVSQAQTDLNALLEQVQRGEEVVLQREGVSVARLVAANDDAHKPRRVPGQDAGKARIAADFDAPLPHDIQQYFE